VYSCAKGSAQKNLDTDLFYQIELFYPKSKKLQILLVDFWEMILESLDDRLKIFDRVIELCGEIDEAFLYKTFTKIEWGER